MYIKITLTITDMDAKIIKTEIIEATEFSTSAIIISLDSIPSESQQKKLFAENKSVVLEF